MKSKGSDDSVRTVEELIDKINENPDAFNQLPDEILAQIVDHATNKFSDLLKSRLINNRFKEAVDTYLLKNKNWVKQKLQIYPFNDAVSLANLILEIQSKESTEKKDGPYQTLLKNYAHSRTYAKAMGYLFTLPRSQALQFVRFIRGSSLYLEQPPFKDMNEDEGLIYDLFTILFAENVRKTRVGSTNLAYNILTARARKLLTEPCLNSLYLTGLTLNDELYKEQPKTWRRLIKTLTNKTPLSYVNASGTVLSGNNLSKLNLSGFNFSHADLLRTDFTESNLSYCNLTNAALLGAQLDRVDLSHAILTNVNLNGAYIPLVNLTNADLNDASFTGILCLYQKKEDQSYLCDFIINLDHPELPRIIDETIKSFNRYSKYASAEELLKTGIYDRYEKYNAQQTVSAGKSGLFRQPSMAIEESQPRIESPKSPRAK